MLDNCRQGSFVYETTLKPEDFTWGKIKKYKCNSRNASKGN